MLGGERHGIAQAQRIGVEHAGLAHASLGLVGGEDDGLVGAAHEIGEIFVVRRHADARIDHEEDGVGLLHRGFRLPAHAPDERAVGALLEAGRVDDGEGEIGELRLPLAPVARDARAVVDERELLADEPVEQRRFADIGPADDGEREGHGVEVSRGRG